MRVSGFRGVMNGVNFWTLLLLVLRATAESRNTSEYWAMENCLLTVGSNTYGVVGLRPNNVFGDCRRFFYCRVTGFPDRSNSFPVEAFSFTCPEKEKPFYDARTCSCVEEGDHCRTNYLYTHACSRLYNYGEPVEPCNSFKASEPNHYYEDIFPDFSSASKFWKCSPSGHPTNRSTAYGFNCPFSTYFDIRTCRCEDDTWRDEHEYNINPMNRYRCAKPLP